MVLDGRVKVAELALVSLLGVANVVTEGLPGTKILLVALGAVLWSIYVIGRTRTEASALRDWGFRTDNLEASIRSIRWLVLIGALGIVGLGYARGTLPPPAGFWIVLAVYPLWGVAQQFLLNGVLARNLSFMVPPRLVVPLSALLFAASHAPDVEVMALALPAGALWVWAYRRVPNLWVLGVTHGVIGTMVFYLVLGRDPLSMLLP